MGFLLTRSILLQIARYERRCSHEAPRGTFHIKSVSERMSTRRSATSATVYVAELVLSAVLTRAAVHIAHNEMECTDRGTAGQSSERGNNTSPHSLVCRGGKCPVIWCFSCPIHSR